MARGHGNTGKPPSLRATVQVRAPLPTRCACTPPFSLALPVFPWIRKVLCSISTCCSLRLECSSSTRHLANPFRAQFTSHFREMPLLSTSSSHRPPRPPKRWMAAPPDQPDTGSEPYHVTAQPGAPGRPPAFPGRPAISLLLPNCVLLGIGHFFFHPLLLSARSSGNAEHRWKILNALRLSCLFSISCLCCFFLVQ